MSTNKALLKHLEDTLLQELSNATGNILDNHELIATLESAKEKAVEISQKLAAAKVTAKDIDEARVRYSPVAARGAVLFFVMASLSAANNMYECSLGAFLTVFNQVGINSLNSMCLFVWWWWFMSRHMWWCWKQ
jgi:dynein heavy chain